MHVAHGFQEFWGYLYHLDAMQQVSFPDINSSPTIVSPGGVALEVPPVSWTLLSLTGHVLDVFAAASP